MTASATEIAVLGGGCFWCLDAVFRDLEGVIDVESGYAGGSVANPSYEAVCSGRTGHAEVVKVTFDPARLDYADLLRVFFAIHDPDAEPPGQRHRDAVPLGDLRADPGTGGDRQACDGRNRGCEALSGPARHRARGRSLITPPSAITRTTSRPIPASRTACSSSHRRWRSSGSTPTSSAS